MTKQELVTRIASHCMAPDFVPDQEFWEKKRIFIRAIRSELDAWTNQTAAHAENAVKRGRMSADQVWTLFVLTFGVEH